MTERNNGLLQRIDERTKSIMHELKSQNEHLSKMNGRLEKHDLSIVKLETTIYSQDGLCDKASNNSRNIVKLMICVAIVAAGVGGGVAEIIKVFT